MTDPSNVITTDFLTSLGAAIKQADKPIKLLETKSAKAAWFKDVADKAKQQREALLARIEKKRDGVGKLPRKDASITTLIKEITEFNQKVATAAKKEVFTSFYYGTTQLASEGALLSKVQSSLPAPSKGNASQALTKAVNGTEKKDAAKAGAGVKHASSGVEGVSSATVFYTMTSEQLGLESRLTIVGVGSHKEASSYDIYTSFVPGLKEKSVFKL